MASDTSNTRARLNEIVYRRDTRRLSLQAYAPAEFTRLLVSIWEDKPDFVPVARAMVVSLFRALGRHPDWPEVERGIGKPHQPSQPFGPPYAYGLTRVEAAELVLAPNLAASVTVTNESFPSNEYSLLVSSMFRGRSGRGLLNEFTTLLECRAGELGLTEGAKLQPVPIEEEDLSWLDDLPQMTTLNERSSQRIRAAMLLEDEATRRELIALNVKRGGLEGDLPHHADLAERGLIEPGTKVRCSSGRSIFRPLGADDIPTCPMCGGTTGTGHVLEAAFGSTRLAKELTTKSRWMVDLAIVFLQIAGVPREAIRVPEASLQHDEIDLAFAIHGERWIAELKDDSVNPGDAGRIVARADAAGKPHVLVVTTQAVEAGAAAVLDKLQSPDEHPIVPALQYSEGSDCVGIGLRNQILTAVIVNFSKNLYVSPPADVFTPLNLVAAHFDAHQSTGDERR